MRRLHLALQSPCWPADVLPNGIARYVATARGALEALGIETRVLAATVEGGAPDPTVIDLGGEEHRSLLRRLADRCARELSPSVAAKRALGRRIGVALAALDRSWPVDVFEIEESFGLPHEVRRHHGKPMVVRLHGPWCAVAPALGQPRDRDYHLRVLGEGAALRAATAISSPSQSALDAVRGAYHFPLPPAEVIPNPVPLVEGDQVWTPGGCGAGRILFVGRFDRVKGADTVLEAFARVARARPEAQLIFAGPDAGLRDGATTYGLAQWMDRHLPAETRARVSVLGQVGGATLAALRREAAVTVVASRYETFSLAAVEALATGSPLVTSTAGGLGEIARAGETCLTFTAGDAGQLAAHLMTLLADPSLAARLGAAGRADTRQRFAPAVVARRLVDLYERVREPGSAGVAA